MSTQGERVGSDNNFTLIFKKSFYILMTSRYNDLYKFSFSPVTKLKSVSGNAFITLMNLYECKEYTGDVVYTFCKVALTNNMDILHREIINLYVLSNVFNLNREIKAFKIFFMDIIDFCVAPILFLNKSIFLPHNIDTLECFNDKDKDMQ